MPLRSEFQALSLLRIQEAKALVQQNLYDGAFYIAGYAIEFSLKAAVCRNLDQDDFFKPDRRSPGTRYVQDRILREFKTHNYEDLLILAGLSKKFERAKVIDTDLKDSWSLIGTLSWSENCRYNTQGSLTAPNTEEFIQSIEKFLSWIQQHW